MFFQKLLQPGILNYLITLTFIFQLSACNSGSSGNSSSYDDSDLLDPSSDSSAHIELSWIAPSSRENNKPISLSEIAGYKIYFGSTPGNLRNNVAINDGTAQSHTFYNVQQGEYYFALTTLDSHGRESKKSPPVKIVV